MLWKKFSGVISTLLLLLVPVYSQTSIPINNIKFQSGVTGRLTPSTYTVQNNFVQNFLSSPKWRKARGLILEPVALDAYKTFVNNNIEWVDATYNNGKYGIDGLGIIRDSQGQITDVQVIEIKSGNAILNAQGKYPQFSHKWVMDRLERSVHDKSNRLLSASAEEQKILRSEIATLEEITKSVNEEKYSRFLLSIYDENGELKVGINKILKDTYHDIPQESRTAVNSYYGTEYKEIISIDLSDKNKKRLSANERKIRDKFLEVNEDKITEITKNKKQTRKIMENIKKKHDPNNNNALSNTNNRKKETIKANAIKFSVGALIAFSEIKTFCDFIDGKITTSDFAFYTTSNALNFSALFTTKMSTPLINNGPTLLKSFSTPIVLLTLSLDVFKNIYSAHRGHITKTIATINTISTVSAFTISTLASSLALKCMGLSATTLNPVGFIVTGGTAVVSYIVADFLVKKAGYAIVNAYEEFKNPHRFNEICTNIRRIYAIK